MNLTLTLRRRLAGICAAGLAAVTLSGCGWLQDLEMDPTRDWTANQLYTEARSAMSESNWTQARDYYTKPDTRSGHTLSRRRLISRTVTSRTTTPQAPCRPWIGSFGPTPITPTATMRFT